MNSFSSNSNSENFKLRQNCLEFLGLDIIGVAETKLRHDDKIVLHGYQFFGQNRKNTHVRARSGSGGIGLFVKDSIIQQYDVRILDSSIEGSLWVQLSHRTSADKWNVCVVYLPPHGTSREVDAAAFFEDLHAQIFSYQNEGKFAIMGDFNSRIGDSSDFIEGVDNVIEREVLDQRHNAYSDLFSDFLISSNCIILNGRSNLVNDYTCISTRGLSVVDYMVVPHHTFDLFSDSEVIRARTLFNDVKVLSIH